MFEKFDELIERYLNLIGNSKEQSMFWGEFLDTDGKELQCAEKLAKIMEEKNLIKIEPTRGQRCDLTEFGIDVWHNGGWLKNIENSNALSKKQLKEKKEKEELEFKLAQSNIEANEHNKRIAEMNLKNDKKNRLATWLNIIIGMLNVGLLIWQIFK